ncbi:MAG TPA: WecB/TagA/CpsF family glycosyltransferase [Acidobacteriaceae bacterium]|jgi:N-acetylglucosaminyldiphosphoundecaprenol N-acetyl-beta-D-mannosaminyltransferase|nr:WecB/TagA/CpsF family glycosyltransferase [Acidobacteriaceae bacterium]
MSILNRTSVAVLGVPFDNVTMDEAVDLIEDQLQENRFHQVATANVDFLMHSIRDPELQEILCSCDLVVPDGMPIVWAARMMGVALKERVSGVDLVPRLADLSARGGYGIFLLGASEDSSRRAAESMKQRFPGVRIVGRYSPPISSLDAMDHEDILARIELARPDILLVAMGNPKQEKWLNMHRDRLEVPICMGVGGSLDFLAGTTSRAPAWMQNAGFEWLHRLFQEPGRLTKRYLNDARGLARHLPSQLATSAVQPRKPVSSALQAYDIGSSLVVVLGGDIRMPLLGEFDQLMAEINQERRHTILDMSSTAYLGPDALGSLIRWSMQMHRSGLHLWLAGAPAHVRRVMRSALLDHCFSTAASVADAAYRIERTESMLPGELIAARSVSREARDSASVQLEILQGLCKRVGTSAKQAEFSFGRLRSRVSPGRAPAAP